MDDVLAKLRAVEEEARGRLEAAATAAEVDALERELLGNASTIGAAKRGLRDLPEDQRREVGRGINEIAGRLTAGFAARRGRGGRGRRGGPPGAGAPRHHPARAGAPARAPPTW